MVIIFSLSSPQYKLCIFSIWLNVHIADVEYLQGTFSPIFAVEDFSGLSAYPSTFWSTIQGQHK